MFYVGLKKRGRGGLLFLTSGEFMHFFDRSEGHFLSINFWMESDKRLEMKTKEENRYLQSVSRLQ